MEQAKRKILIRYKINKESFYFTLFDRKVSFGMRITIGARFSVDRIPPPLVDSAFDDKIEGFVKDVDIDFIFPFCPLTR